MDTPPAQDDTPRDPALVLLKWLVIGLTATMMVGMVVLIWLFVTRLPEPMPPLPEAIALPEGETAVSFTHARDFLAVVTAGGEILIYSPDGTTLRQRVALD